MAIAQTHWNGEEQILYYFQLKSFVLLRDEDVRVIESSIVMFSGCTQTNKQKSIVSFVSNCSANTKILSPGEFIARLADDEKEIAALTHIANMKHEYRKKTQNCSTNESNTWKWKRIPT